MATSQSSTSKGSGRKTASSKKRTSAPKKTPIRRELGAVASMFLGIFALIGFFTVDGWFITYFCGFLKGLLGWGYYLLPPALFLCAFTLMFHRGKPVRLRVVSALLLPLFMGGIAHLLFYKLELETSLAAVRILYDSGRVMVSGGLLGGFLAVFLEAAFSIYGAVPMLVFLLLFFGIFSVNLTPSKIIAKMKEKERLAYEPEPEPIPAPAPARTRPAAIDIPLDETPVTTKPPKGRRALAAADIEPLDVQEAAKIAGVELAVPAAPIPEPAEAPKADKPADPKQMKAEVRKESESIAKTIEAGKVLDSDEYSYPPLTLLRTGGPSTVDGREEIAMNRERLETTIRSFGVSAAITDVTRGPTVTRYDVELEAGVKLNKLTNLAGDLALSLGVVSVRIAPIPDKISTVGVEVPNKLVSTVYLHDIVDSPAFKNASSRLTFAIGEDIAGNSIVGNIAKLPHMLIAGTTGSGKSVCMNSLILSLLFKATPEEVRLIMIDPKMVELGIYNGIPHLFIPVVTDPKKAAGALQWAVVEMLKRYRLFSEAGVRDLTGYNQYQRANGEQTLPQVVIVIDELADLMLVASKEVEESICRVAQMGRASGMHLVIATQRPSADVITGLMKANIPSRIAFAVSSAMESRIILDAQGAEKLIGAGDMLYSPIGSGKPVRIQGAFVSDAEREAVVSFVKERSDAHYSDEIMEQIERAAQEKETGGAKNADMAERENDYDELLPQAVEVILETSQASVSLLQRRLKLGYSRAARLVDQMEELGVVGPFEGSKPRQLLVSRQQWQEMGYISGGARNVPQQMELCVDGGSSEEEEE